MRMRVDLEYKILHLSAQGAQLKVDFLLERCPICHQSGTMSMVKAHHALNERDQPTDDVQIVYICPLKACQRMCIVHYSRIPGSLEGVLGCNGVYPFKADPDDLPGEAVAVSPEFENIYVQAKQAEATRLDHLAGMGYRKSLEFLIKDYLISLDPASRDAITVDLLGACINRRVTNPQVREAAKRAAWLGNDESHYVRRWPKKDIRDLKTLIRLTANWIAMELIAKRYQEEMPEQGGR